MLHQHTAKPPKEEDCGLPKVMRENSAQLATARLVHPSMLLHKLAGGELMTEVRQQELVACTYLARLEALLHKVRAVLGSNSEQVSLQTLY